MNPPHNLPPQRIASLSTEAVDVLYRLGVEDRVVGVSGFTHYPRRARDAQPKISGFKTGKLEKILAVQPDLVIGYSHIQRRLLEEVECAGVATRCYHHRSLAGIHAMVMDLGELVHAPAQAQALSQHLQAIQDQVAQAATRLPFKPRVYFEEWLTPLTCGIQWAREGFATLNATLLDIPSSDILAPGLAAIERGLVHVFDAVCRAAGTTPEALGFARPTLTD